MTFEFENGNPQETENPSGMFSAIAVRTCRSQHREQDKPDVKPISGLDTACSGLTEEPVESARTLELTKINKICRSSTSKWQVSNSVVLPPRVTEREVNTLAAILKARPKPTF